MSRTAGGRAKTPGGMPGENGSRRGSAGCCGAKRTLRAAAEILEADGGGQASDPGQRRRLCRIGAGLESEGRHLVLLVADAQCEVLKEAANDGLGAIVQWVERRYVAVPPLANRLCAGEIIRQLVGGRRGCCV